MATHALEALAEQSEWRWRVALDRLGKADPFLAADLLNRLTTVIDFGEGRLAPAWPTDEVALAALRTDLLDPRAAPETVRRRAAAFIALVSPATAWVIDDAGSVDAETGATMAIFGVADRAGRGITARAAWSGESAAVEVAPLSVRRLAAVSERRPSDAPLQGASAVIELGARRVSVEALPLAAPVRPPGLRIGPGFQAWTLDSWTEGRARPAAPEQSFSILLHRRGDLVGSGAGAWQFYIECPVARGGEGDGGARRAGFLRLWFGPTARPVAALRLGEDGTLVEEVSGAAAALVHFERREDRIVAIVALPEGAVERDGVLRIAVERVDAEGRRATWPRPVLPWESAIGRAALDLASWRALTPGAAEPVR